MANLVSLSTAKTHLRITVSDHDGDISLKIAQASDIILDYLKGRRLEVSSIAGSAGLATVTTTVPHGLSNGNTVTVRGAAQPEYNGAVTVTVTGTYTFTYPITTATAPASPATGGIGISTAQTWTDTTVPQPVKAAVLLMLTHLYDHRGEDLAADENLWNAIGRLLMRLRDPAVA